MTERNAIILIVCLAIAAIAIVIVDYIYNPMP